MGNIKLRVVLELDYDNYGHHGLADFTDTINEGLEHLIDEGLLSGYLEAILEDHMLSVSVIPHEVEDEV